MLNKIDTLLRKVRGIVYSYLLIIFSRRIMGAPASEQYVKKILERVECSHLFIILNYKFNKLMAKLETNQHVLIPPAWFKLIDIGPNRPESIDSYKSIRPDFDYHLIILHKNKISHLPFDIYLKSDQYQIVFESRSLQLLKRNKSNDLSFQHFIYSGKFKSAEQVIKCRKLAFIHIPKTAGTSITHVLRQILPSLAYVAHPKQLPNYHLNHYSGLAGHLHFEELQKSNFNPDFIFSIIRHPKARLISTFCYVRREQDTHDFSPAINAMRQQTIMDFLETNLGAYEVYFVSRYLGGSEPLYCDTPEAIDHMQKKAISNIEKYNIILFDANKLDSFERFILKEFDTKIEIPHKNVNQEIEQYFTQQELDFINDGLDCYLEKEVLFYEKLRDNYLYE